MRVDGKIEEEKLCSNVSCFFRDIIDTVGIRRNEMESTNLCSYKRGSVNRKPSRTVCRGVERCATESHIAE